MLKDASTGQQYETAGPIIHTFWDDEPPVAASTVLPSTAAPSPASAAHSKLAFAQSIMSALSDTMSASSGPVLDLLCGLVPELHEELKGGMVPELRQLRSAHPQHGEEEACDGVPQQEESAYGAAAAAPGSVRSSSRSGSRSLGSASRLLLDASSAVVDSSCIQEFSSPLPGSDIVVLSEAQSSCLTPGITGEGLLMAKLTEALTATIDASAAIQAGPPFLSLSRLPGSYVPHLLETLVWMDGSLLCAVFESPFTLSLLTHSARPPSPTCPT